MKTIQLRFPVTRFADTTLSPLVGIASPWERHALQALHNFNDALTCLAHGDSPYIYWPLHLAKGTRNIAPATCRALKAYPLFHVSLRLDADIWRDLLETRLIQMGLRCRRDLALSAMLFYAEIQKIRARDGGNICFPGVRSSIPVALLGFNSH